MKKRSLINDVRNVAVLVFVMFIVSVQGGNVPNSIWDGNETKTRPLFATVQEGAKSILLNFVVPDRYKIYRKLFEELEWGDPVFETIDDALFWEDDNIKEGVLYEYMIVGKDDKPTLNREKPGGYLIYRGYVSAGVNVDNTGRKGKVILLVETFISESLKDELKLFKMDLIGDGWSPFVLSVESNEDHIALKSKIQNIYNSDPDNFKHVILLGSIPVAYSGSRAKSPDGHSYGRPFPADCFYADLDGLWTDATSPLWGTPCPNSPNDGKFDQDTIPSSVEMGFGRIDLRDLETVFPGKTKKELYQKYFEKEHQYRHSIGSFKVGVKSTLRGGHKHVNENSKIGLVPIAGVNNFSVISGKEIKNKKADKIIAGKKGDKYIKLDSDIKYSNSNGPFLFYVKGGGVPSATYIAKNGFGALGLYGYQSHWGIWDKKDNPMRTLLAADGYGLICFWMIRASFPLHLFGSGRSAGDMMKRAINNNPITGVGHQLYLRNYMKHDFSPNWKGVQRVIAESEDVMNRKNYNDFSSKLSFGKKCKFKFNEDEKGWKGTDGHTIISLMGNPTLRLFPVIPPSDFKISSDGDFSWTPSSDEGVVGYKIYRATSEMGDYELVSNLIESNRYKTSEKGFYMLRAIKLQTTGSGTFWNPSQGVFAGFKE